MKATFVQKKWELWTLEPISGRRCTPADFFSLLFQFAVLRSPWMVCNSLQVPSLFSCSSVSVQPWPCWLLPVKLHSSYYLLIVIFGPGFTQHFSTVINVSCERCFFFFFTDTDTDSKRGLEAYLTISSMLSASKQTISFYNKDTRGEIQKATFDSPQLKKIFHGSFHKVNAAAFGLCGTMYSMWIDTRCGTSIKNDLSCTYMCSVTWGYADV